MKALIELEEVVVSIKGKRILKELSLNLSEEKGVLGLIGLNGAGKTSLIKTIFSCYPLSSGKRYVHEEALAFAMDVPDFPPYLTAEEVLSYSRWLSKKGVKPASFYQEILRKVGLEGQAKKQVAGFSRGMRQRLGIAAVLVLEPQILFFDEPTSALDPKGREDVLAILRDLGQKQLVIFSSHILSDVEQIAQRIVIIHKGSMLYDGSLQDLIGKKDTRFLVRFTDANLAEKLRMRQEQQGILLEKEDTFAFIVQEKELAQLVAQLDQEDLASLVSISKENANLQSAFEEVIGKEDSHVSTGM